MRREAVQRALRLAQGCDFTKVVNRRGLRLAGGSAVAIAALAVALCLWRPAVALTAVLRLADPYGEHDWPHATQLALLFRDRIAVGQPFVIEGKVRGVIPAKAVIEFEGLSSSRDTKEYPISEDEAKVGTFRAKLDMTRQQYPFRFRVRANDATEPRREGAWFTVGVAQPPRLASLGGLPSPQVELYYPAYTDKPSPEGLSPGVGRIEAIAGTRAVLRAAADRPIAHAWLSYRPTEPLVGLGSLLGPVGVPAPIEAAAAAVAGQSVWDRVPGRVEPDGRRFTVEFQPPVPGQYVLTLEDEEGLTKDYDYDLLLAQDPIPAVRLLRPAGNQSVLPDAEITLQVEAEDDLAVRSAWLEYRRKDRDGHALDPEPLRLPLYDHQAVGQALPPLLTALAGQPAPPPAAQARLRPRLLQLSRRWPLQGLVKEGDVLVIQACADDFNDVSAHHTPGRSHEVELRVVGPPALAAVLDEAQARVQQELLRLREWQEKALKKVIAAEQQARATGKLRPEDFDGLVEAEQLQKQIQARVGPTKEEGLRAELRRLEQMMRDNHLPPSGARDRLQVMKEELDRLAQEHLPPIEPQITSARQKLSSAASTGGSEKSPQEKDGAKGPPDKGKEGPTSKKDVKPGVDRDPAKGDKAGTDPEKAEADLDKARAHQEEVQQTLDGLLKYLEPWASTQEIKGETRAVLQEQRDLKAELEKLNEDFRPEDEQAQAAVRKVAELQRRLADRTQRLLDKMERVAHERAEKDPSGAAMLEKAAKIGKDADLVKEMQDTDKEQLREKDAATGRPTPLISRAITNQGHSAGVLEEMVQAMEEQRKEEVERLVKKQKDEQKNVDDLADRLERLQKKVREAMNITDTKEKRAALQKLAEEQRRLEEEARKKSRELARLQVPRAGRDLARAAEEMGRAAQQLDDGEDPDEAQKEALERLEDASDKLQQAQAEAQDELAREQLAKVADQIKGLKERQDAAVEESARIQRQVLRGGWRRALVDTLRNHRDTQDDLAKDAAGLAEKLKGAPAFEMIMKKAGKAMGAAAKSITERKEKAVERQDVALEKEELADEARADARTQKVQKAASGRLQRLLDALGPELQAAGKQEAGDEQGPQGGGGPQGAKGGGGGDGIPPRAQLKVLRDEQHEVNERTKSFAKEHPDVRALNPEQRAELEAIHADQEEIFRLFRELMTAVNEGEKQ
jgi:hypothetical protein